MWYEDRWPGQTGFAIARASRPEGPFTTIADTVVMHGKGRPGEDATGDFDLFVDDDGSAYQVRTGLVIEKLTPDFMAGTGETGSIPNAAVEAPALFKRGSTYYVLAGSDCCACRGGSNVEVFTATSPLGPYTAQGDVGSDRPFQPNDPDRFVTHAQASDVFKVPAADGSVQYVWLGNQWVTAGGGPGHARDGDLLYWSVLAFDPKGAILPFVREDAITLSFP
jgi:beta-xylosidase